MPVKKGLIASILFISIALSSTLIYFFQYLDVQSTAPLLKQHSPGLSYGFLQSQFSSKGLIDRIIQLKLNFTEAALNSEKVEVTADVQMPFEFNGKLYFKWKLGQDVILSEGKLTGEINGIKKNEIKKISIAITGFSKENNHHIGFEIYGIKNGKKIYGDALIASDLENTFENVVQNVEKIKSKK